MHSKGRYGNRCARISSGTFGVPDAVIVVGGSNGAYNPGFTSTEILDSGASAWRAGPLLPIGRSTGVLIRDPRGSIFYIGGLDGAAAIGDIFRLKNVQQSWELIPQVMQIPKFWAVGLIIPDDLSFCHKRKFF